LSNNPRRDRAIVLFVLDTGCRASELCRVRERDVDMEAGRVQVTGKGAKERLVYLGRRALSALWLYVNEERPEHAQIGDDHLFVAFDGYPTDHHTVYLLFRRLSERAEVHATPHQLRHSSAIEHLRAGIDLMSVQRLLGHEKLQTTQTYLTALADEDVEQAARRTSPADNWRL
jgi:integrase/recombinase XerD